MTADPEVQSNSLNKNVLNQVIYLLNWCNNTLHEMKQVLQYENSFILINQCPFMSVLNRLYWHQR